MSGELILLVDDEPNILQLARMYMERDGYRVESVGDGLAALEAVHRLNPALVILDLMLPGMNGLEVCRRLRAENHPAAILMLTARDEAIDKVLGLEIGADDYLTKPFNPHELTARVKAILRLAERATGAHALVGTPSGVAIQLGNLKVDPAGREVQVNGRAIPMRAQEFDLLLTLIEHKGIVLTREQLLNLAWGYEYYGHSRTVDVHIGHLRRKLETSGVQIETVTGVGYKLVV